MASYVLLFLYLAAFSSPSFHCFSEESLLDPWYDITRVCLTNCSCVLRDDDAITKADCSSRGWTSVPENLPSTLEVLDISNNHIGFLAGTSLVHLHNLVSLNASFNLLESLSEDMTQNYQTFSTVTKPDLINQNLLSRNDQEPSQDGKVTMVIKDQGDRHNKTRSRTTAGEMSLSLNRQLSPFSMMTQLETLHLQSNLISQLPPGVFINNRKLKTLDLSSNQLPYLLLRTFEGLSSLAVLNLRHNKLRYVNGTFPDDAFSGLLTLKELDLHTNQPYTEPYSPSSTYPDVALSKVPSLEILRLDAIPSIFPLGSGFRALSNLTLLDMSNTIDPNDPKTDYSVIIDLLDEYFINITTVRPLTVLLTDCHIYRVYPRTFSFLPSLHSLSLRNNHHIKWDGFLTVSVNFPNTSIKHLDISDIDNDYNLKLNSKYFKYLSKTSLETLIMEHNKILDIDPGVFFTLHTTNIRNLSLALNKLMSNTFFPSLLFLDKMEVLNVSRQSKFHVSNEEGNIPGAMSHTLKFNNRLVFFHQPTPRLGVEESQGAPPSQKSQSTNKSEQNRSEHKSDKSQGTYKSETKTELENNTSAEVAKGQTLELSRATAAKADKLNKTELNLLVQSFCPTGFKSFFAEQATEPGTDDVVILRPNKLDEMRRFNALKRTNFSKNFYTDISMISTKDSKLLVPRKLRELYASELKLGLSIPKGGLSQNVLEILDLSKNFLWCFDGPVTGVTNIEVLDLSENYCLALSQYFFNEWSQLRKLYLSSNVLGPSLEVDETGASFSRLHNLEYIDLSYNSIRRLPTSIFKNNYQLKIIVLKNNTLQVFRPTIGHLKKLELLDLSHNGLNKLTSQNMLDLNQLLLFKTLGLQINLRDNNLHCTCSDLSFLNWFLVTNVTFLHIEDYTCTHENGSIVPMDRLDNFIYPLWRQCYGQLFFNVTLTMFFIIISIMAATGVALYYKNVLYFYYYISNKRYFRNMADPERYGVKDVFVVYDDQEVKWRQFAARILKERLESRGVTCHFSEVDGYGPDDQPTAGRTTRDVIEDSVLKAKKTLVLLTQEVFLFEEQELEVNMAKVCEDMRDSKVLIFLELEKFTLEMIPKHIQRILQRNKPLAYGGDNEAFWNQLVQYIKSDH